MSFGGFDSREGPMRPMAEINTTPLVDVMLVLLVIFIITAPLLTHAIRLDLPGAQAPVSTEKSETITLSIDAEERLYWNDAPLADAQALRERLARAAARDPQPELQLRADRQVRYQRIAEVMSAAQQAGVTRLGFVTDPKAEPSR
jgi:biopolymer transport protein ExbD